MSTFDTAALRGRATTDEPNGNNSGDCAFCTNRATGVDARTGKPVCRSCGTALNESEHRLVTDGGYPEPDVLDVVDAPEGKSCRQWVEGDDGKMVVCGEPAAVIVVFDAITRPNRTKPRNLLACDDHGWTRDRDVRAAVAGGAAE